MENGTEKPDYGNWVSEQLIIRMLVCMIVFAAVAVAAFWIPGWSALGAVSVILAVLFLIMYVYFLAARYVLSWEGGGVQPKVLDLLLSHVSGEYSNVLDIGCGSGALTVKLAKRLPSANVTGIDFWQGKWEYSAVQCQKNASADGVAGRTLFQQASASHLPFEDGVFDLVVSNFTFHEVRDAKNKWDVVKEALRVLKPGGTFVFQDLFLLKSIYGEREGLVSKAVSCGARKAGFIDTSREEFIARLLKLPFMLGSMGILYGEK